MIRAHQEGDPCSDSLPLTAADVNAAFRKHIDPGALSIVKAGDFNTAGAYR